MPQNKELQALVEASVGHSFSGNADHLYRSNWLCWFSATHLRSAMGLMPVKTDIIFVTEFCGDKRGLVYLRKYVNNLPFTVQGVIKYDNIDMARMAFGVGWEPKGILVEKAK